LAADFENSKLRPFLSIRWKLFLTLACLVICIHLVFMFGFWKVQKNLYDDNNQSYSHAYIDALDMAIGSLSNRLDQSLTMITSSHHGQLSKEDGLFSKKLASHLDDLIATNLISYIGIYNTQGELVSHRGSGGLIDKNIMFNMSLSSKPITGMICDLNCNFYVIRPLIAEKKIISYVVVQQNIAPLLADFSYSNDIQIGLFKDLPKRAEYIAWDEQIFNLTKSNLNIPLLVQVLRNEATINTNQLYPLDAFDNKYLIKFDDYIVANKSLAKWVFIKDTTEHSAQFITLIRSGFICLGLSLILSLLALYIIIHRIAHQLPSILALSQAIGLEDDGLSNVSVSGDKRILDDELQQYDRHLAKISHKMDVLRQTEVANADKLQTLVRELNQTKNFIDRLLNDEQTVILMQKLGGEIIALNQPGSKLFEIEDFHGKTYAEIFCSDLIEEDGLAALNYLYLGGETLVKAEVQWRNSKGDLFILLWVHALLSVPGTVEPVILSICVDITEQRKAEERLEWLAFNDPSLMRDNKQVFLEYLPFAVRRSLEKNKTLALLFCEISGFTDSSVVSETDLNTALVESLNAKIEACLREYDMLVQLSEEHFVVVLEGLNQLSDAEVVTNKILSTNSQPIEVDGQVHLLGITIGASYAPEDTQSVPQLLKNAEDSMFQAKRRGVSCCAFESSSVQLK
jgi:diguanylate cyclase (GGDEF)-like protein/PAS domain S-box-containing protein